MAGQCRNVSIAGSLTYVIYDSNETIERGELSWAGFVIRGVVTLVMMLELAALREAWL